MESYAPLFERMGNDEFAELQNSKSLIENLQQRLQHLEEINLNLEHRLEQEAKSNIALENECDQIDMRWKRQCGLLENDIKRLTEMHKTEMQKNERLRENLSRTEKELYGILQRKYELMRGGPVSGGRPGSDRRQVWEDGTPKRPSEQDLGGDGMQQIRAPQDLRRRKVTANLAEFLGLS